MTTEINSINIKKKPASNWQTFYVFVLIAFGVYRELKRHDLVVNRFQTIFAFLNTVKLYSMYALKEQIHIRISLLNKQNTVII